MQNAKDFFDWEMPPLAKTFKGEIRMDVETFSTNNPYHVALSMYWPWMPYNQDMVV